MKVFVFSGFNPRGVLSFLRLFEEYNIDIYIIAKNVSDPILFTKYKRYVKLVRDSNDLNLNIILQTINIFRQNNEKIFILPSTEYLNRILSKNSEFLKSLNILHGLVDYSKYILLSDKLSFCGLCDKFGISIPKNYNILPKPPYVLKPKYYLNSLGKSESPKIILNLEQESDYLQHINLEDFFVQEYVSGESIYTLCHVSKNKTFNIYSQKNYIQQPKGGSILLARSSFHYKSEISRKIQNMLFSIDFFGLIMIEFRKTQTDWIMIEANPRIWGPSQLVIDSGMNLFDLFLLDNDLIESIKHRVFKNDTEYLWSGGFSDEMVFLEDESLCHYSLKSDIYNRIDSKEYFKYERTK